MIFIEHFIFHTILVIKFAPSQIYIIPPGLSAQFALQAFSLLPQLFLCFSMTLCCPQLERLALSTNLLPSIA